VGGDVGYELFSGISGLDRVAEAWFALEQRCHCQTFQTYEFARLWQDNVGERIGARPLILTYAENDRVSAVFPACVTPHGPLRLLTWLSGPDLQDYGDVLRDADSSLSADEFVAEALLRLRREARTALLYLTNVRDDAVASAPLAKRLRVLKQSAAPFVRIEGEFDEYLRSLPSDKRHHLERCWRRLSETGEVRLEVLAPGDAGLGETFAWIVGHKLERFARLGEHDVLLDPGTREFRMAQATSHPDSRVARMTVDGTLVAAELVCVRNGRLCTLVPGFDDSWAHLSPGKMLHYLLLCDCFERGFDTFDMGWGTQRHKFVFTQTAVAMTTFVDRGPGGAALSAALRAKRALSPHASSDVAVTPPR